MGNTEKCLKVWKNHKLTDKRFLNELLEKTDFVVNDGLFEHHTTFFHIGVDGYYYYRSFFGTGWNKRKPDKNGYIKFLNSLVLNVNSLQIMDRREYYNNLK